MPGLEAIPQQERLRRRVDFEYVYKHGERVADRTFICYIARREGAGRKFGMAVSRKVGNAVVRNRVKRRIREAYRHLRKHLRDDVTIVIVARAPAAQLTADECEDTIGRLLRKGDVVRA